MRFGHTHRNGLEAFEELFAAAFLSASFVVSDESSFVACSDLSHFDAGVILVCEFVDQVAEVHSMFGQEVEYDSLAAEQVFDGDQFHIELHILYFLGAEFSFICGRGAEMPLIDEILRVCEPQDFSVAPERIVRSVGGDMLLESLGCDAAAATGVFCDYGEDLSEFDASVSADDNVYTA